MLKRAAWGLCALILTLFLSSGVVIALLQPPRLPTPAQGSFTIRDVALVNPGVNRRDHVDIRVERGVIRSIRPAAPGAAPGDITCPGCTALPGLMDMHAHLPPRAAVGNDRLFALLFLANGVTTIRELGSADGGAYGIRDAIAAGRYPGPRVISCGRVLDGDPPTRANNVVVRNPDEGRAEVRKAAAHGARCIKMYNMLRKDVVLAIADEAARRDMPIVAHVPHSVSLLDAPYIRDVQHLTGVPEASDPVKLGIDDYINADFANLTDARIAAVTAAALRQGTIHTPALVNEESRRVLSGHQAPDPQIAILPDIWPRAWRTIWQPSDAGAEQKIYEGFLSRDRAAVKAFFDAGVTVYAGTDTLMPFVAPGSALKTEIRDFAGLGLTPEQALTTATTAPGHFWKGYTYGQIAEGLPADIVLYAADPTQDLNQLEASRWVIADGRPYARRDLDRWVERYRRHFHGWTYSHVMGAVLDLISQAYRKGDDQ